MSNREDLRQIANLTGRPLEDMIYNYWRIISIENQRYDADLERNHIATIDWLFMYYAPLSEIKEIG